MPDWSNYLPNFSQAKEAVRTYWRTGAAVAGVLFLLLAAVTYSLPRTYQSEAKLFVKVGRETLTLDPTATTGQTVSIYESRENEINSILEVLRSREVLEGVVDLLGVDAMLHGGALPRLAPITTLQTPQTAAVTAANANRAHRGREREEAVLGLERHLRIWSPKRSSVVCVHCEASSPQLAQATIDALLTVYRTVHAEVNSTKGSYAFFADQEGILRAKWHTATTELRQAKDQLGIASLEGKKSRVEGQLADVQQRLLSTRSEIDAAQGKIDAINTQLTTLPRFTETSRSENPNAAADTMRGNLYQLQMKEKEYLSRFTESHPQVTDVQEQLAELRTLLEQEGRTRVQTTSSLNPAWSQLESALLSETSNRESLESRAATLATQNTQLLDQLRSLNREEIRLTQLQQSVDLVEKSLAETSQRLEQARINRDLAHDQITNVNVFQPASFVSKAIAPKRSIMLALSLFVSLLAGTITTLGLGMFARQVTALSEIASRLQLPVVARLPAHQWQAAS